MISSISWWDSCLELCLGAQLESSKTRLLKSRAWILAWILAAIREKEQPHWGNISSQLIEELLEGGKNCMPLYKLWIFKQLSINDVFKCLHQIAGSGRKDLTQNNSLLLGKMCDIIKNCLQLSATLWYVYSLERKDLYFFVYWGSPQIFKIGQEKKNASICAMYLCYLLTFSTRSSRLYCIIHNVYSDKELFKE